MKLLMLSEFFPEDESLSFCGGVEARNFYVARALSLRHEVTVLTSRTAARRDRTTFSGINVVYAGPPRPYSATTGSFAARLGFMRDAIAVGKTIDFDVVEGSNFVTHFVARHLARHARKPGVAFYPDRWLGEWFAHAGIAGVFGEALERLNLNLPGLSRHIVTARHVQRKLSQHTTAPIALVPCGIDDQEKHPDIARASRPTIICVARFVHYKNHAFLLRVFARVKRRVSNAKLVLIGAGPEQESIERLAHSLGISAQVALLSQVPREELLRQLGAAWVFAFPSLVEGFGIATVEAASLGLPYVCSDIDVHREILAGQGGFLVSPHDEAAFASKLCELLQDDELRRKKSEEARVMASQYHWSKIAEQTERIFSDLLQRSAQQDPSVDSSARTETSKKRASPASDRRALLTRR